MRYGGDADVCLGNMLVTLQRAAACASTTAFACLAAVPIAAGAAAGRRARGYRTFERNGAVTVVLQSGSQGDLEDLLIRDSLPIPDTATSGAGLYGWQIVRALAEAEALWKDAQL